MRKSVLTLLLGIISFISQANNAPLYQLTDYENKQGLFFNGELCLYPIYDKIELVEPIRPLEVQVGYSYRYYRAVEQRAYEILAAEKANWGTFGSYQVNKKKGLMTMSQRTTPPIYDEVKLFRHLRMYKDLGDQIVAFAVAKNENGYGVVDLKGNVLIPFEYSEISYPIYIDDFKKKSKNLLNIFFAVVNKDGQKQVIDINNNPILGSSRNGGAYVKLSRREC